MQGEEMIVGLQRYLSSIQVPPEITEVTNFEIGLVDV